MAHKTLVGSTAYEIKGGKTLINGTAYKIKGGKTLVGGTAYKIDLKGECVVTIGDFDSAIMGAPNGEYANATINGQVYDSSQQVSLVVQSGQSVHIKLICTSEGRCSVSVISSDSVSSVSQKYEEGATLEYTYTVNSDCYIDLSSYSLFTSGRSSQASIFDNGCFPFSVLNFFACTAMDGMTWGDLLEGTGSAASTVAEIYERDGYVGYKMKSTSYTGYLAYNGVKVKTSDKIIPCAYYDTVS